MLFTFLRKVNTIILTPNKINNYYIGNIKIQNLGTLINHVMSNVLDFFKYIFTEYICKYQNVKNNNNFEHPPCSYLQDNL